MWLLGEKPAWHFRRRRLPDPGQRGGRPPKGYRSSRAGPWRGRAGWREGSRPPAGRRRGPLLPHQFPGQWPNGSQHCNAGPAMPAAVRSWGLRLQPTIRHGENQWKAPSQLQTVGNHQKPAGGFAAQFQQQGAHIRGGVAIEVTSGFICQQ